MRFNDRLDVGGRIASASLSCAEADLHVVPFAARHLLVKPTIDPLTVNPLAVQRFVVKSFVLNPFVLNPGIVFTV
jgi:hypothetical protein